MKFLILTINVFLFTVSAFAVKMTDYSPFQYDVRFTNPICETVKYKEEVFTKGDTFKPLLQKPKNVYCTRADKEKTYTQKHTPHYKLIEWIQDESTKELFLTYLSFSNKHIISHLCQAIKDRGIRVTIVYDSHNERRKSARKHVDGMFSEKCMGNKFKNKDEHLQVHFRGNEEKIGLAHNKLFFVNPNNKDVVKIAFSSGNMSSGTSFHHENWHFITLPAKSYFNEAHRCLMNGMIMHGSHRDNFKAYIQSCRGSIQYEEEEDIKAFFIPGPHKKLKEAVLVEVNEASAIDIAVHRYSLKFLTAALEERSNEGLQVRFIADDDLYWTGQFSYGFGKNTLHEWNKHMTRLLDAGVQTRYMETNHKAFQLHHNKFLLLHKENGKGAVFAGAGNFTGTAFKKNLENFYLIKIESVYKKFVEQYERMWNQMATEMANMPEKAIFP